MKASLPPGKEDAVSRKNVNKSNNGASSTNKPLHKYKFYLDVKNRITVNKLELKIKELGGVVEFFLVKEITHVVTDREEWSSSKGAGSQPRTPQFVPNESSHNDFGTNDEATTKHSRPKTRADAMLERARKTPACITKDPLEEAKNLGIAIWTIDKTLAFLEQVVVSLKTANKKSQKFFELRTPFVKFEAFDRQTRPIFQEIRNWPQINFQGSVGDPGIIIRSFVERNMTRKTRSHHPRLDTALQPGYCEVCRADYLRLDEHLESDKHLNFIKDHSNFLQLDTLISNNTNIDNFLKLNCVGKVSDLNTVNSDNNSKRMLRQRTASLCDKIKNSPLSPTGSDSGHRLRSRRHCNVNYVGTIVEDDQPIKLEGAKEARELRSSTRQFLKLVANEQKDTWDSGRPKRSCNKQKNSIEDRLLSEAKLYYKVEVLSNKLRSSEPIEKDPVIPKKNFPKSVSEGAKEKSIVVKFRKMRSCELRQLNNEAENFLFPKKDESSSEDDIDADNPNTTASADDADSTILLSSENEEPPRQEEVKNLDEASLDSNWSENSARKKKRRTHAEAFILDNQKYYKFETPCSRLRYHGSYLPPVIAQEEKTLKHNGEYSTKILKQEKKEDAVKKEKFEKLDLNDLVYSFERVPKSEPWYQTFRRQDEGQEYYTCFSDSGYWKPFLLPYQLGHLPPLDPRICMKAYQDVKKQLLETSSAATSVGSNTPDPNVEENQSDPHDEYKNSEESNMTTDTKIDDEASNPERPIVKMKSRRRNMVLGKNPRKSPRQHASTLAILSSLIHQRKKRSDFNKSRSCSDLDVSRQSLSAIPEKEEEEQKHFGSEIDYEETAKQMDEVLNAAGDMEQMEISGDESPLIRSYSKLNAIDLLNDFDRKERDARRNKNTVRRIFAPGKRPGRKKKKNRTGWPNKNNRKHRKEEIKEEELDCRSVNSFSVVDDSENECENETMDVTSELIDTNHINNIDQSTLPINIKNSGNVQTSIINELNIKQDRVLVSCKDDDAMGMLNVSVNSDRESDRVVDLEKWETAEKVLSAKLSNSELNSDIQYQPYVRVQKLASDMPVKNSNRRQRGSSSPLRTVKRARRVPPSPKSPRILRRPRGRWYRER